MTVFKRWSNSSITTLQMCGEKFRLKHIEKDYRPIGYKGKRGSAVHVVAKEAHKRQIALRGKWEGDTPLITEEPGTPRSLEEAADITATAFDRSVEEGVPPEEKNNLLLKAEQKDCAIALGKLYVGKVAPSIVPLAVERKIEIKPRNMDIVLVGYLDLVETDNGDIIRDLKTKEKAPYEEEAANSQQLTLYTLMHLAKTESLPKASRLVHLVRTPSTHKESIITQETTRTMEDINRLVARINVATEAVEKGVFVPADPSAPGSPCGYCEFSDGTCKYFKRKIS